MDSSDLMNVMKRMVFLLLGAAGPCAGQCSHVDRRRRFSTLASKIFSGTFRRTFSAAGCREPKRWVDVGVNASTIRPYHSPPPPNKEGLDHDEQHQHNTHQRLPVPDVHPAAAR